MNQIENLAKIDSLNSELTLVLMKKIIEFVLKFGRLIVQQLESDSVVGRSLSSTIFGRMEVLCCNFQLESNEESCVSVLSI